MKNFPLPPLDQNPPAINPGFPDTSPPGFAR
jgi:hypothetical protein